MPWKELSFVECTPVSYGKRVLTIRYYDGGFSR
jgi:hypothetical protein